MKKAALVMATSVAFFFSAVADASTRNNVNLPTPASVAAGEGAASRAGDVLSIAGPLIGDYIERTGTGTPGVPIKVLPRLDYSIPTTITQAKTLLRGGVQGLVIGTALQAMLDAVGGFIDTNGKPAKTGTAPLDTQLDRYFSDRQGYVLGKFSTADKACQAAVSWRNTTKASSTLPYTLTSQVMFSSGLGVTCTMDSPSSKNLTYQVIFDLKGTSCPSGSTYDPVKGACMIPSGTVTLADSDYDLMGTFADGQNGDWLKELLRESCSGSNAPDKCFESLVKTSALSGPSQVQGPSTTTTISGPDGVTTSVSNTNYDITYGPNYYDYRRTVTTTTTKPDGSTSTTTTEDSNTPDQQSDQLVIPPLSDPYKPVIDKYNSIAKGVSVPADVPASIPYSPWYTFSGLCTEFSTELPVIGYWSTNYCPYVVNIIRPVLAFLLSLYTWHTCRQLWSEALRIGRPI